MNYYDLWPTSSAFNKVWKSYCFPTKTMIVFPITGGAAEDPGNKYLFLNPRLTLSKKYGQKKKNINRFINLANNYSTDLDFTL